MLNHDCMAQKPESIFFMIYVYSTKSLLAIARRNAATLIDGTFSTT